MANTPRIVVHSKSKQPSQEFNLTENDLPVTCESEFLNAYRKNAFKKFMELPLPNVHDEAWRRTDLKGLAAGQFKQLSQNGHFPMPENLLDPLADKEEGGAIIQTTNKVDVTLDRDLVEKGVIFTDFADACRNHADVLEKTIGKVVNPDEGKFAALAAAFGDKGCLLYVPKDIIVEKPLHSILWGSGGNQLMASHLIVWLEAGASATYIHEASSDAIGEDEILHAGIVEIYVGPGAHLQFVELQSWGENVWNFSHERAHIEKDGSLEWIFGAMGSKLTKNFSTVDLVGDGSTGKMSGFYFCDHHQHLDHDTQQNHLAPHTTSDLLFKGALLGESRSVWQGMIYVAKGAAKTDGYQANRNLVLSPNARADSIPGLEILADDVRCTHGATVGKIDPELVFYLNSRGIPKAEAERLVVEGFFDPIMQRIPFEGVRGRFQRAIHEKMKPQ